MAEEVNKILHIYSQPYEHAEARIVGNREALAAVAKSISVALSQSLPDNLPLSLTTNDDFLAADGEGYAIEIIILPDDSYDRNEMTGQWEPNPEWAQYRPHYCDRGYNDDTHKVTPNIIKA